MFVSDEDRAVIYETLRAASTPYTHDEVVYIVTMERRAWDIVQKVTEGNSAT